MKKDTQKPHFKEEVMKKMTLSTGMLVMVLVFVMTVVGCATRLMGFTVASVDNVDMSRMGEYQRTSRDVTGTTTKLTRILFFDITTRDMRLETAVRNALRGVPGAVALINVEISKRSLNFLLFALDQYVVKGQALVDPNIITLGNNEEFLPELVTFDETGEVIERVQITQDEFNQYLAMAEYKIIE
jgi:branched-subunit amino acid transport protein